MDLRHMRHFVAVAEELHFGRAAKRLHIAQPPLSQSIQRLEADLGVQLFDRSRRGVSITDAGHVFLREARRTLMHADMATKLTRREALKVKEVSISFIGPALYRLLPALINTFTQVMPDTNIRLFEQPSATQIQSLIACDVDIAFVTAGVQDIEGCMSHIVERARLVAVIPSAWPLAQRASVTMAELAEYPFILPPAQKLAQKPADMLTLFNKVGVVPLVIQESTHASTTLSLVGAGLGFSLITATAALMKPLNVSFVPISDIGVEPHWGLMMVWRPDQLSASAAQFVERAVDYVQHNPSLLRLDPK